MNNKLQKIFGYINLLALVCAFVGNFFLLLVMYLIGGLGSAGDNVLDAKFYIALVAIILSMLLILVNFAFTIVVKVLAKDDENFTEKKVGVGILITNIILTILTVITSCFVIVSLNGNTLYIVLMIISLIVMISYVAVSITSYVKLKKKYAILNSAKQNAEVKINLDNFNK